jgi:hypothetical protein
MIVEIGTEAAQVLFWEYKNRIFFVHSVIESIESYISHLVSHASCPVPRNHRLNMELELNSLFELQAHGHSCTVLIE